MEICDTNGNNSRYEAENVFEQKKTKKKKKKDQKQMNQRKISSISLWKTGNWKHVCDAIHIWWQMTQYKALNIDNNYYVFTSKC